MPARQTSPGGFEDLDHLRHLVDLARVGAHPGDGHALLGNGRQAAALDAQLADARGQAQPRNQRFDLVGGAALAVSCDLRVASETSALYVPEVERGMNMSWGSIPRFVALVGPARAKRIAGLCEKVSAETALSWGLVDHVTAPGSALAKAREVAEAAAKLPPTALKMVKQDVNVAALALAKATAHRDLEAFALMQQTDDFREGVKAFFEKRDPDFTGD